MYIRNVQRAGEMHYLYLPKKWCAEQKIGVNSKLTLHTNKDGSLQLFPSLREKGKKHINLNISNTNTNIIHKLIVACYINPASSFSINLKNNIDLADLLKENKLIKMESVEIEKNTISSESSVSISDPGLLLKTMIRKVKNLIVMMKENYNKELIQRYEEEIDKSKLLIEKSVISSLTFSNPTKLKIIDLYYMSLISKELENLVDNVIQLWEGDPFIIKLEKMINILKDSLDFMFNIKSNENSFDFDGLVEIIKVIQDKEDSDIIDLGRSGLLKHYDVSRAKQHLMNIVDVLLTWKVTNHIDVMQD